MKRHVLGQVAACAVASFGASLPYGQFFAGSDHLLPLGIASVGGALAAAVAAARRWSFARTLFAACAGFVLLAIYGVFGETVAYGVPTAESATELFWGVAGGWARMLTVGLPADVRGELLVTPVLLAWAAAFVAVTLAVRARSVLAPTVSPLIAFVVALLFAGSRPGIQVTATAVFLGGVLVLILLRANRSALAFGVPVIIGVAGLGIASGYVLPLASDEDRLDPRDLYRPPVRIADTLTPLAKVKGQLREQPPRRLFTVRMAPNEARPVDRIRIAALDEYDGSLWTSADEFVLAGRQLAADRGLTKTWPVSAHVEIDSLAGPFLPAFGKPTRLDLADWDTSQIGFSKRSGMLATTEKTPHGLHYTIVGDVSSRDDGLLFAQPSTGPEFHHYTALPNSLPSQVQALAQRLTSGAPTPYGKLVAIERYLRGHAYSLDAEPGHSYGALTGLLTGAPGVHASYAEQHAAAFAVLARAADFPARVAVGYRLPNSRDGVHSVTTSNAHAWAEVAFDDYGWVMFEPTDPTRTPSEPQTPPDSPVPDSPPLNPPLAAAPVIGSPDSPGQSSSGWSGPLRTTALAVISLLSLSTIAATLTVTEKARRRRRRRRAGSHSAQVLGAWREVNDRLIEQGITIGVSATADEAAGRVQRRLGTTAEPVVAMAPLATTAVFASGSMTDQDVARAWQLEAQLCRRLHPRRLSARWLRARLDPRPLLAEWREARQSKKNLRRLGVR